MLPLPPSLKASKNHPKAPKLGPETPLDRRGSSDSAGVTQNQPRRAIPSPFLGSWSAAVDKVQSPLKTPLCFRSKLKLKLKYIIVVLADVVLVSGQSLARDRYEMPRLAKTLLKSTEISSGDLPNCT